MKIKCPEYEWYNSCYFQLLFQEWAKRVKWLDGLTGAWDSGEKHNKRTKSPRKRIVSKLSETSIEERNSRGLRCQFTSTPSPIIRPTAAKRSHHRQSSGIMRRFGCLVELFLHRRYFVLILSIIILTPSSPHKSRLPFQMSHINMVVMKSNYHCIGMLMFNAVFLYFLSKITEITEITSTN